MDAAKALAELTEISSQIETAAIADEHEDVVAAAPADAASLVAAGGALLAQATRAAGREPAQLSASTRQGSVFVLRDGGRTIVATTMPDPNAALVFHDLRSCLSSA